MYDDISMLNAILTLRFVVARLASYTHKRIPKAYSWFTLLLFGVMLFLFEFNKMTTTTNVKDEA